ncbi:unnamed protein product [Effrenium voratum]|nr:unnamed protein product [Effrenium voratum]
MYKHEYRTSSVSHASSSQQMQLADGASLGSCSLKRVDIAHMEFCGTPHCQLMESLQLPRPRPLAGVAGPQSPERRCQAGASLIEFLKAGSKLAFLTQEGHSLDYCMAELVLKFRSGPPQASHNCSCRGGGCFSKQGRYQSPLGDFMRRKAIPQRLRSTLAARRPCLALLVPWALRRSRSGRGAARNAGRGCPLLLLDPCRPQLIQELQGLGCQTEQRGNDETVEEALCRAAPEVVVVRSSLIQEPQLAACKKAPHLVMRAGAGVDNLAVPALAERGVVVCNAAGANAVAVAELTMAHLLNLDRRLSDQVESLRRGQWQRLHFAKGPRGLYGRTLAVLGLGSVGREVARLAKAFGMNVRAWSRSLTSEEAEEMGVAFCGSMEEAAFCADAITVHLPLTAATRGVVGLDVLMLAPGALFVNMSRGGVVDEEALLEAVKVYGIRAGLDVFANEPGASDTSFHDEAIMHPDIYGSHHTGARTEQAAEAVEQAVLEVVSAYLEGRPIPGRLA